MHPLPVIVLLLVVLWLLHEWDMACWIKELVEPQIRASQEALDMQYNLYIQSQSTRREYPEDRYMDALRGRQAK